MEGEGEENQDCNQAVDNDPQDGHWSTPNLSAMAGDYLYDTPSPPHRRSDFRHECWFLAIKIVLLPEM
jgi:hypothetical protein